MPKLQVNNIYITVICVWRGEKEFHVSGTRSIYNISTTYLKTALIKKLSKRLPVVSYPWIFRTQAQFSISSYPVLRTIRTQQIMTQNV